MPRKRWEPDAGNQRHVFGARVVYLGEMSNGKWSLRVGSQEGDVGSWRHGDENRNHPMVVRAEEVG